jgi:PKD repeat protein
VSLTVANANGTDTLAMSDFVRVVEGLAPEVHFGTRELAFERMGAPPLEISFRDYSRFSPTAWLWDFGDGATSTQQHPVHTYTEYGNFTVGLTVSNDYGSDTATAEHYIAVGDSFPPIAHPGYSPADGFAPLTVAFEDRSWWEPTSWLWDFGDGATSTEQHPVHTYTEPGSYHIDLTVSNALGSDSLDGGYLVSVRDPSLLERPPEADFSYDADLNALRFRDRSGWYPTAWHWDFGDGATSAEQHPVHVYTGPGIYTVTLIAENAYGPGTASKAIRLVSLELLSEIPVITPGEMATVDIVMDVAPAGLSGYTLTVAIDDPERATVTAIAYPSWGLMHKNGPLPASETFLSAADLEESVVPGSREITLATIALEARTEGTANLTVAAARLDDDEGLPVYACVLPARIGVRPLLAVPNSALPPQDLDGDGLCEDINGNGRADFDDVVVFYRSMGWIADNEPTGAFDYNKNGRIDFQDLVLLYRSV